MSTNGRLPNYINGQWQDSTAKEFADVIDPGTGETLAQVPLDGVGDVSAAIESAAAAFPAWRRTPPEERIQYLFKLKQLFEAGNYVQIFGFPQFVTGILIARTNSWSGWMRH